MPSEQRLPVDLQLVAHTLDLHLGFPSGSVIVPPYSTGNCSGLICLSKTSFQFAGRRGKDRNVSLGRTSYLAVSPEEAEKAGPALKGRIIGWHGAHVTQDCRQEHH